MWIVWIQCLIGFVIGGVLVFIFDKLTNQKEYQGNLILIEEEAENETYAFMELHCPISEIKNKEAVLLKIQVTRK